MRLGASGRQFATPRGGDRVLPPVRRAHRRRARRHGARRGVGAAVHRRRSAGARSTSKGFTPQPGQELQVDSARRHPDYFRTMEIPLMQGTVLHATPTRCRTRSRSSIIDEKFAQRFWPGEDRDRQAPLERSQAADDDRRRRRHGEAVRPRRRRPHRRLSADRSGCCGYQVARTSSRSGGGRGGDRPGRSTTVDPTIPVYDVRTMTGPHAATRWRGSASRRSCWARSRCSRCSSRWSASTA